MPTKYAIGSFNGKPTIILDTESKWAWTFGLNKARLAIEHIEAIKEFVRKHDIQQEMNEDRMAEAKLLYGDAATSGASSHSEDAL